MHKEKPKLLDQHREVMRLKHYSVKTGKSYSLTEGESAPQCLMDLYLQRVSPIPPTANRPQGCRTLLCYCPNVMTRKDVDQCRQCAII